MVTVTSRENELVNLVMDVVANLKAHRLQKFAHAIEVELSEVVQGLTEDLPPMELAYKDGI